MLLFAATTFSVGGSVSDCLTISLISGPVIFLEAWYDSELFSLTLRMPRPPCLIGIEIILLSFSLMSFPNNAGMRRLSIASSSGLRLSLMLGMVLLKYVYLCCSPCVYAAYAACGSLLAMSANVRMHDVHFLTFSLMYSSLNSRVPIEAPKWRSLILSNAALRI